MVCDVVRLTEHQGKRLLSEFGMPVPRGALACSPSEAREIAEKMGNPVAIKAQALVTGRFKAGGIRFADDPTETEEMARSLLGSEIKGTRIEHVLIEEKLDIQSEYYMGVTVDDSAKMREPVLIFSSKGGVDIEQVRAQSPEAVATTAVDYIGGISPDDALKMAERTGVPQELKDRMASSLCSLYEFFKKFDAKIVELNPFVSTKRGQIYAADCRVNVDDHSIFRHPELHIDLPRDMDREPWELEKIAWTIEANDFRGSAYFAQMIREIKQDGYVGFHGMGGGGAMLAADALVRRGLKIANYSDTSGNPTGAKVYRIAKVILSQTGIEGYIVACPNMASQEMWYSALGLVKAFREDLRIRKGFPVVVLWAGNKEEEAHHIMKTMLKDMPIHLELYGRERLYDMDFVADRMKKLIEEYRCMKRNV
jgi:succinyl-CoA synthetase beta subunit